MSKYFKIYKVFIKNAISYEAQYRANTWFKLLLSLLWTAITFLTIEIIFNQTPSIAGWSKAEIYLLSTVWLIASEIFTALFSMGLWNISSLITSGDLDIYLTKPVSTLFLVSCKQFIVRGVYRLIIKLGILVWVLYTFHMSLSLKESLIAISLLLCSVIINYAFTLIPNTFSFWLTKITNVNEVMGEIADFGRFPLSIWPKAARVIFLTILPVGFMAYVPVAAFLGRWPWYAVLYTFIFTALLFFVSVKFWNYAIKRYSSASS